MLWVKAFHIISMVCWFSGLFYLPRLFVYHAMSDDHKSLERFKIMERKLLYGITTPGAVLTILLGICLLTTNLAGYMQQAWMHAKLGLVFVLLAYHGLCWKYFKAFRDDKNTHSHVFYRWFNEFPVVILIAVVVLVVVKP